jgi:biotin operon repressor
MGKMADKEIPDIIVGRLPRYLRILQKMAQDGVQTTSSQELGEKLGISAAQIRKDLSQFGEFGMPFPIWSGSFRRSSTWTGCGIWPWLEPVI